MVNSQFQAKKLRYFIQGLFLAFILQLIWRRRLYGEASSIIPSPEAYCPFGGLESLYSFITSGLFIRHIHLSNLVVFIALLTTVIIGKSFFCGWICPVGTLQEWVRKVGRFMDRLPAVLYLRRRLRKSALLKTLDRVAINFKYLLLVYILLETSRLGALIFRSWDPYPGLISLGELRWTTGVYILLVILNLSLVTERPFCRYACPLGALIGVLGRLSLIKVTRNADNCIQCGLCHHKCPMGVNVKDYQRIGSTECISCLNCLEICPKRALELRVPKVKIPISKYLYVALVMIIFLGMINGAKYFNYWSTSGRYGSGKNAVIPQDVHDEGYSWSEIRGRRDQGGYK